MNVKKFTGKTSREALRRVREALGADAVILSNRVIDGTVEILALANDDISSLAPAPSARAPERAPERAPDARMAAARAPQAPRSYAPEQPPRAPAYADQAAGLSDALEIEASQFSSTLAKNGNGMAGIVPAAASPTGSREIEEMKNELRAMRGMMEMQLAELSWGSTQRREPQKTAVLREILAAGFSPSLARYLMEKLPANKSEAECMRWVKSVLQRNLATMSNEDAILEKGGVFALVGPTGVGKTTSTAKLAARCVMRHGTDKLALITTDGYRIGGHEQLRIYGKILGVMVHSVKDEADLRIALKELRGKHTVLIDTVGVSQRDRMVAEQVAMLSGTGVDVKRLLCLNATSTGETLGEVVRAYQGGGLAGCIMTKLDEAASIGNVLDVVIRQKLAMYYVSNGQRVPEDLHLADPAYLIDRAFKLKRETAPFQYQDAELPLVMGAAAKASNDKSLREVNFG